MRLAAINGEAICECGHPMSEHARDYVYTRWMGEGPDAWYGVCPCVRWQDTPDELLLSDAPGEPLVASSRGRNER